MKSVLLTIISVLMVLIANAQIEVLDSIRVEADPMTSSKIGRVELRSKHVVIELYDNGTVKWWLRNPPHIFVGDRSVFYADRMPTCKAKVAVYKADGTLLAIAEKWKGIPSEHGKIMDMFAKGKIVNHRKENYECSNKDSLTA